MSGVLIGHDRLIQTIKGLTDIIFHLPKNEVGSELSVIYLHTIREIVSDIGKGFNESIMLLGMRMSVRGLDNDIKIINKSLDIIIDCFESITKMLSSKHVMEHLRNDGLQLEINSKLICKYIVECVNQDSMLFYGHVSSIMEKNNSYEELNTKYKTTYTDSIKKQLNRLFQRIKDIMTELKPENYLDISNNDVGKGIKRKVSDRYDMDDEDEPIKKRNRISKMVFSKVVHCIRTDETLCNNGSVIDFCSSIMAIVEMYDYLCNLVSTNDNKKLVYHHILEFINSHVMNEEIARKLEFENKKTTEQKNKYLKSILLYIETIQESNVSKNILQILEQIERNKTSTKIFEHSYEFLEPIYGDILEVIDEDLFGPYYEDRLEEPIMKYPSLDIIVPNISDHNYQSILSKICDTL